LYCVSAFVLRKSGTLATSKREDTKKTNTNYPLLRYFFVTSQQNKKTTEMSAREDIVFSRDTVEFVTVAAEFCAYVERSNELSRKDFVDTLLKILPLLYIKAQMLPDEERISDEDLEDFVSEDSYEIVRMTIFDLLADKDTYLDVFVNDMKYSDTPITKSISEDIADIYQDIKNFVCLFQLGINETMHDAIIECNEHFRQYWGQTLTNTLRALHDIRYNTSLEDEEEEGNEL
jgi:hypothetical protein